MEKELLDLTAPQKSIWLTEQFFSNTNINNICGTAIVYELLDFEILKKAINIVIEKNDAFQLKFINENGSIKQYFGEYSYKDIEIVELESENNISDLEQKLSSQPFKFDNFEGDLFEFKIFKIKNSKKCGYMLNIHHIISDAITLGITCQQIMKNYIALKNNDVIEYNEIATYRNYIKSEQEYLNSQKYENDKKYWLEKFNDIPNIVTIPSNKKTSSQFFSCNANRYYSLISKDNMQKIKQFCEKKKISVFNLFMSLISIYMFRVNNINDFVIGTPILNRTNFVEKNTLGMFINVAPLKIDISNNMSINDLLEGITRDTLGLLRHQKYSYQTIIENLRKTYSSIPNLYNIVLSYQITKANIESNIKYETRWAFNNTCANDIDIHLFDLDNTGELHIAYDYNVEKYDETEIINLNEKLLLILNQILENDTITVENLNIVTSTEEDLILNKFNSNHHTYPTTSTLIELFEQNVEKNGNEIALVYENEKLTYTELNNKVNKLANFLRFNNITSGNIISVCMERNINFIISILAILKLNCTFLPINTSYPLSRIQYILNNSNSKLLITESKLPLDNIQQLKYETINFDILNDVLSFEPQKDNPLAYIIYTSGSTGTPKGVMIKNSNLINFIYSFNDQFDNKFSTKDKCLSLTNISFDVSICEIFTPLILGSTLVLYTENILSNIPLLCESLEKYKITFAYFPPNVLLDIYYYIKNNNLKTYLNKLLVGVEPIKAFVLNNYRSLNKNIEIVNGYGPTEATICSTFYKFTGNEEKNSIIPIGKPLNNNKIVILNSNNKLQPLNTYGELYISGENVGAGYLNNPDLTNLSYIKIPEYSNDVFYKTGDIAAWNSDGTINFKGRNDTQIKLRGNRIELGEINSTITQIDGIKTSITILQEIKNNKYICSYIVSEKAYSKQEIKSILSKSLPWYMIPNYIIFIDELPLTVNGKIDKKNLPKPVINIKREFIKPRNYTDQQLINIISGILSIKEISITDNLFDLGMDSLSIMNLSSQLYSTEKIALTIKDIFYHPTILELSDFIITNTTKSCDTIQSIIHSSHSSVYYPSSNAQKRIFYTASLTSLCVYNISGGIEFPYKLDYEKTCDIFNYLINRHEAFRTYFEIIQNELYQKIVPSLKINIKKKKILTQDIDNEYKVFNKKFNLGKAPLLNCELLYLENDHTLLLVNIHHIISDGTSLNILLNEFCNIYNGKKLPNLKFTYRDFINYDKYFLGSDQFAKNKEFWLNEFKNNIPVLNLPTTYNRPLAFSYNGAKISSKLNKDLSEKIINLSKTLQVTPYMLLLSAYYILLYKYTSQTDIVIGTPIANRDIPEFSNIIGMFVNTLAIRKSINTQKNFTQFVNEVKEKCLMCFEHQNFPFDELVKHLDINRDPSRNPIFDTMFIYQNDIMDLPQIDNQKLKYYIPDSKTSKFDLSLEIIPQNNEFLLNIEYYSDIFSKEYIENFIGHYTEILNKIAENPKEKITNISMISLAEYEKIVFDFNNVNFDYPKNIGVAELFENQVLKTPFKTALVFENEKFTYFELNQKANQLAHFLEVEKFNTEEIICVLLDKSIESIVALLAILKLGCAYLPIDIHYPKERIDYIIKNSNSKYLLTTRNLINKSNSLVKTICIDLDTDIIYKTNNVDNPNYKANGNNLAYIMYTSGSTGNPKGVMIEQKSIIRLVKNPNFITFSDNDRIIQTGSIVFDAATFEIWGALLNGLELYVLKTETLLDIKKFEEYLTKNKITIMWLTAPLFNQICEENPNIFNNLKYLLTGGDVLSPRHINMAKNNNPDLTIINGYGPTENTTFSCCFTIDKKYKSSIPIGYPISGSTCYIVSPDNNIQPIGVPGELLVGGDGVARGYFNNLDLTNKKFINLNFSNTKLYRTGDLVKWRNDGSIDFLGRIDNQVKIHGYRIELNEITTLLSEYPKIKEVYTTIQMINSEKTICSYFVANKQLNINDIFIYLKKYLPKFTVPKYIIQVDKLEKNQNGKIDKKLLTTNFEHTNTKRILSPTNKTEEIILETFKRVLNQKQISTDDNFFDIGGDSLLAMKLQLEFFKENLDITYADIFRNSTVKDLANLLLEEKKETYIFDNNLTQYDSIIQNNTIEKLNETQIPYTPIGNILITGVTGFLGIHILDSFLKNETGIAYCLTRSKNNMNSVDRLKNTLHFYFQEKYDNYIGTRIKIVDGDITVKNLGMKSSIYEEIGNNVNTLIHSAALVKHFGNFEEFEKININGTKNIINFCKTFNTTLMHISTISVSGNNFAEGSFIENNIDGEILYSEKNFYVGQNLDNLYVKSKFIAEKLILDSIKDNTLKAYILRMGNLTSRYSEGKFQQNHFENSFVNRIKSILEIGYFPDYLKDGYTEFTPIDYCGDAIIKIANHYDPKFNIFHLLNDNHLSLLDFQRILKEMNINIKMATEQEFNKIIEELLNNPTTAEKLTGIIRDFNNDKKLIYSSNIKISSQFSKKFLEKINFYWPIIDKRYIENYINYLSDVGYINLN